MFSSSSVGTFSPLHDQLSLTLPTSCTQRDASAAMGAGVFYLATRDVRQGSRLAKDGAKQFRQNIKTLKEWAEEAADEYARCVLIPSACSSMSMS